MRMVRVAIFTIFWSLLACLLILIIAGSINPNSVPPGSIPMFAIVVVVIGLSCLWFYEGPLLGNFLALFPAAIEPGRRSTRDGLAVLAYVEQAIRMNAPLSPILEAAAKTEYGRLAWRLRNLRELIDAGADLSIAIQEEVPEVSDRAVGMIIIGERTGQLRPTLTRLMSEADQSLNDADYESRFALAYTIMMLAAMTITLTMLNVFVEPKFRSILRDFQVKTPQLNQWVVNTSMAIGPILGVVVLVLMVIWFVYGLWVMIRRPRGAPRDFWGLVSYLASLLPWVGQSQRDRSWADVCHVLSDSFAAGWPAGVALQQTQDLSLAPAVLSAVRRWNEQVQTGKPLNEAAADAGLPRIFVGILASSGDQTLAALDFLARYYANRFSRLRILLRGAMVPIAVTCFGICVALIALSIFMPIIEMINHMAGWVENIH